MSHPKNLKSLAPNPRNPRKISAERLAMLKKSMREFGDLGGIVQADDGTLVGGHQRVEAFRADKDAQVVITQEYEVATDAGTLAEGYVLMAGERFSYRQTNWTRERAALAAIAANQGAGEWDLPELADWLRELRELDLDLDLTMLDVAEREKLLVDADFVPTEDTPPRLDERKPTVCPSCGHEFGGA